MNENVIDIQCLIDSCTIRCPEYDLTNFGKCLSVCDPTFAAALAQKLMN